MAAGPRPAAGYRPAAGCWPAAGRARAARPGRPVASRAAVACRESPSSAGRPAGPARARTARRGDGPAARRRGALRVPRIPAAGRIRAARQPPARRGPPARLGLPVCRGLPARRGPAGRRPAVRWAAAARRGLAGCWPLAGWHRRPGRSSGTAATTPRARPRPAHRGLCPPPAYRHPGCRPRQEPAARRRRAPASRSRCPDLRPSSSPLPGSSLSRFVWSPRHGGSTVTLAKRSSQLAPSPWTEPEGLLRVSARAGQWARCRPPAIARSRGTTPSRGRSVPAACGPAGQRRARPASPDGPVTRPGRARRPDRPRAVVSHILRAAGAVRPAPRRQNRAARCIRSRAAAPWRRRPGSW